ncbi:hypothetical protein CTEN210_09885 [Chaetoceros tenuissimus]|uniref:Uncharacterized protein n=1 Tax=Chaetoceros tenuissimus TaxID=426638 RepID=A0AAD3CWZ9_9STRA|nr:hypothetical protein CTEN210_09885 [Chaetoceros tenuissimus]
MTTSHSSYKIFSKQLAIRTTSASISCFMSFLLLVMILWNQDGLKSPYSRIIFFISIGDILQSLGIIIGPHAIPKEYTDLGAYWAKGTTVTCDVAGFIITLGTNYIVPFYTLLLSYYFLKRVKDKVKPAEFTFVEKKIHAFIWVYSLATCIYALVKKLYNPSEEGKHCMIIDTRKYASCLDHDLPNDHDDCARGDNIYRELVLLGMIPLFLTFLLMISNLVRLTVFVHRQEKLMEMESRESKDRKKRNSTSNERDEVEKEQQQQEEPEQVQVLQNEDAAEEPKRTCCGCRRNKTHNTLTRQALVQSSFYIVTFLIIYSLPTITYTVNEWYGKIPTWFLWIPSILYPVNGLFTMLIFTRPKVQHVRRKFPEIAHLPYIVLLLIVIFSGGETPKEIDLGSSYEEESVVTDGHEQGFVDDNRINTQDQHVLDELAANYQISSVGDDDSIFVKIRNASRAIRMNKANGSEISRQERLGEANARAVVDDGISLNEGDDSLNSSVME